MSPTPSKTVSVLTLSLMTVAAVVSLRGLPMMAAEGTAMIFFLLFATVIFLIPAAMVVAELGGAFSSREDGANNGGIYTWVKEAFGVRWGFVAVWLQWVLNIVLSLAILGYAAASLAYLFLTPSLAGSGIYTGLMILAIYWTATAIALRGATTINAVANAGVILGTLLPGTLIILFGAVWVLQGRPVAFLTEQVSVRDESPAPFSLSSIAFLTGFVLLFAGIEVQAVQANTMKDPKRQFPQALTLASLTIFLVFMMGSFAVASIVPARDLSLTAGLMQAFEQVLTVWNLQWAVPVLGLLMAFGAIGGAMSWIFGPSRGLLRTAEEGQLPPFAARTNKYGSPVFLLITQAVIVTFLASLYIVMTNVSVAFFILSAMTSALYMVVYMMMFAAAIWLRISRPDLPRSYRIPGGIVGMCIVSGTGFLGTAFTLIVSFFPPDRLPVNNAVLYVGLLTVGMALFISIPLIIQIMKKLNWKITPSAHHKF